MFNNDDTKPKQETYKNYEKLTEKDFNPYLSAAHALADKVDESKDVILDVHNFFLKRCQSSLSVIKLLPTLKNWTKP